MRGVIPNLTVGSLFRIKHEGRYSENKFRSIIPNGQYFEPRIRGVIPRITIIFRAIFPVKFSFCACFTLKYLSTNWTCNVSNIFNAIFEKKKVTVVAPTVYDGRAPSHVPYLTSWCYTKKRN